MDDLAVLMFSDGTVTVDALPSGDVYVTIESPAGGVADIVMSQPEAIELMQLIMETIKYNGVRNDNN